MYLQFFGLGLRFLTIPFSRGFSRGSPYFVRIVIVIRVIRIQTPFRHRPWGTSLSPYTIFHRLHCYRKLSFLRNINEKIQINKKRIKWKTNRKYRLDSSSSWENFQTKFLLQIRGDVGYGLQLLNE